MAYARQDFYGLPGWRAGRFLPAQTGVGRETFPRESTGSVPPKDLASHPGSRSGGSGRRIRAGSSGIQSAGLIALLNRSFAARARRIFRGALYSFSRVLAAVEEMERRGWVENWIA